MELLIVQSRIRELLARFRYEVEQASATGALDTNRYAETILVPLFREVYGYTELKNLNADNNNFPGIDLGDEQASVAIQVTSTSNSNKVKHTLEKFAEYGHYEKYKLLKIYILTQKQQSYSGQGYDKIIQNRFSFDKDTDIFDYLDLIKVINSFPLEKAQRVLTILQQNLGVIDTNPSSSTDVVDGLLGGTGLAADVSGSEPTIEVSRKIDDLLKALTDYSTQATTSQTSSNSAEDLKIQTEVETARQLVQENNFDAAKSILVKLHGSERAQRASDEIRFNISNLLGCCALDAEDFQTAQGYFEEALLIDQTSLKALVNASTTAIFAHDAQKALKFSRIAYQQDPDNPLVLLAQLQALYATGKLNEIKQLLTDKPQLEQDPRSAAILASIAFEEGNMDMAAEWAHKGIKEEPNNPGHFIMLASILITSTGSRTSADNNPSTRRENLQAAEGYLTQAIPLAEKQKRKQQLRMALNNRAATRYMLGKLEDGLKDTESVLEGDPEDSAALQNKGRILMSMGRFQEAASCFETLVRNPGRYDDSQVRYVTVAGTEQAEDSRILLADAYLKAGHPQRVNDILQPLSEIKEGDETQLGELELWLVASEALNDEPTVSTIIKKLEQGWSNSVIAKLILAGHWARQGNLEVAGRMLEQGRALASGRLVEVITLQLAQIRFDQGNYAEAALLFEPFIDTSNDNPDLRAYVISLYNSRQFQKALPLAAQIRAVLGPLAGIANIEANILEQGGDLDRASKVLRALIDTRVGLIENQIHLAHIEYRRLKLDDAKQIVVNIPYADVQNNARMLLSLAQLRQLLGLPSVLEFAYQARRLDYANPETHFRYVSLCGELRGPDADGAFREPEAVTLDTSVHVKRDDETTVFTILDERNVFSDRGELAKDDPLALALLGHRKGETVVVDSGTMREHRYEIVEIQSKFLRASHESIFLFQSDRLRHPAIEVVHGSDEKLVEETFRLLDHSAENRPDIHEFYYKRRFPLSVVANLVKRSTVEIWLHFVESPEERLISTGGSQPEHQAELDVLAQANQAVLDVPTILTIVDLRLQSTVANRFEKLFVAQGSIDELREYQHELKTRPPSAFAFATSGGGQHFFIEVSPEYVERRLSLIEEALSFIQTNTEVLPAMGTLELDRIFVENLGQGSSGTLALAKDNNLAFYSDDFHLRLLGQSVGHSAGFSTQTLLKDLRERGVLDTDQYYSQIKALAEHNFSFLSMHADALIWALERNAMSINKDVRTMYKPLTDPDCIPSTAAEVLAQVIRHVWIGSWPDYHKHAVLDLCLNTLTKGRPIRQVLPLLLRLLSEKFKLIPLHEIALKRAILEWLRLRPFS